MLSRDVRVTPGNASPLSHHSPSISMLPGETDIDCDNDDYEIESDSDGDKQESTDDDNKIESDSDMNKQETMDCDADEDEDTEDDSEKMLRFIENEMNFSELSATAPVNMSGTANVDSARAPRDLSSMDLNAFRDFVRDLLYKAFAYRRKLEGRPVPDDDESTIRWLKCVANDVEGMLFMDVEDKPEEYKNLEALTSELCRLMYPGRPLLKTCSHGEKDENTIESDAVGNKQETSDSGSDEDTEDDYAKMLRFIENKVKVSEVPANMDSGEAPCDISNMDLNDFRDFVRDLTYNAFAYRRKLEGRPVSYDDESTIRWLKRVANEVEGMLFMDAEKEPEAYKNLEAFTSELCRLMFPDGSLHKKCSHAIPSTIYESKSESESEDCRLEKSVEKENKHLKDEIKHLKRRIEALEGKRSKHLKGRIE